MSEEVDAPGANGDATPPDDGESRAGTADAAAGRRPDDVPEWDDEYLDRVADRLLSSFDLEKDRVVAGERFPLYGRMEIVSQKQFFHPALSYAEHGTTEHLLVRRVDRPTVADLERSVELGHDLADEWIEADEEHYGTEFTFALVARTVPEAVESFVSGFRDRTLLRYGYHGHYEVNLLVAAPETEATVASESTDLDRAFALWRSPDSGSDSEPGGRRGLLGRLFG